MFSLHLLKNTTRATAYADRHKGNLIHGANGCTLHSFATRNIGGDAEVTFSLPDDQAEALQVAEAVDLYDSLQRLIQGQIKQPDNQGNGISTILAVGHFAAYGRAGICRSYSATEVSLTVAQWFKQVLGTDAASQLDGWANVKAYPWIAASNNYISSNPTTSLPRVYREAKTAEEVINDLLAVNDYECGIFPGKDSPNELGCYGYWQPRVINDIDWILYPEDILDIVYETAEDYFNCVYYSYTNSVGTVVPGEVNNTTSRAIYTPGQKYQTYLDLTRGNGYLTPTAAAAIAQAYLDLYSGIPRMVGTITIPFKNIAHTRKGRLPSYYMRAWDNLRAVGLGFYEYDSSNLVDNKTGLHCYGADVSVDSATVTLQVGVVSNQIEEMIARLTVAKPT